MLTLLLQKLFPKAMWRGNERERCVFLTFDDGPVPETTPEVLKILDRYDVKATFFCVGENVERHPQLYSAIIEKGHCAGNHTYNHVRAFAVGYHDYMDNVRKAAQRMHTALFRPPHGQLTRKLYRELQKEYNIVMWDVLTRDYDRSLTPQKVIENVKRYTRNGSIIVFHDSEKSAKNVLTALPEAITYLKTKGYRFDTL